MRWLPTAKTPPIVQACLRQDRLAKTDRPKDEFLAMLGHGAIRSAPFPLRGLCCARVPTTAERSRTLPPTSAALDVVALMLELLGARPITSRLVRSN